MNRILRGHESIASSVTGVERADDQFFGALLAGDIEKLAAVLAVDFLVIDVFAGAVSDRTSFIASFEGGRLRFDPVRVIERATRRHGDAAVVVGRTLMAGTFDGAGFEVASRYTHVFTRGDGGVWRLLNAQGTRVLDEAQDDTR